MSEHWPVLTVRQPWAWAIAYGQKPVENRSWEMRHRGPLWLHAGARSRWDPAGEANLLVRLEWERHVRRIPGWPELPSSGAGLSRRTTLMPFGAVAALAEVTGCHHSDDCMHAASSVPPGGRTGCCPWAARGQWHTEIGQVRPLPEPVPCRGALGLWYLPEDVEKAAREQLEVTGA